uniref:Uncharacterized protein n=1 Tax=Rhizophora mucronata TaxID=61149 RepID=A0A2P2QCR9_RHIMU
MVDNLKETPFTGSFSHLLYALLSLQFSNGQTIDINEGQLKFFNNEMFLTLMMMTFCLSV